MCNNSALTKNQATARIVAQYGCAIVWFYDLAWSGARVRRAEPDDLS